MKNDTAPKRYQFKRGVKDFRLPPNTVRVTRPSRFGNPYKVGPTMTNKQAVELFEKWLADHPEIVALARKELAGKNLACFCPVDEPYCHADVLLRMANRIISTQEVKL